MSLLALGMASFGAGLAYLGLKRNINKAEKEFKESAEEIRKIWLETLVMNGCTNILGQTFDLLDIEPIESGIRAKSLSPRMGLDELIKRIPILEDTLNAIVQVEKKRFSEFIWIKIITKQPQFQFAPVKSIGNDFWVGFKPDGSSHFADLLTDNMFLIGGMRGQGKTMYAASIIANYLVWNKDVELYLFQIEKGELMIFRNCDQVKGVYDSKDNLEEIKKALKRLRELINIRASKLKERCVNNVKQWNERFPKEKMNRVFIIMEELSYFMPSEGADEKDNGDKKVIWQYIKDIVKSGRSVYIGLIGIVQRSTADNLEPNVKSQLSRITFKQESNIDSQNIIDTTDAVRLESREFIAKVGGYHRLIAPTLDEDLMIIKKYLPKLIVPSDYNETQSEVALTTNSRNINVNNTLKLSEKNNEEKHEVIKIDKKMTREEIKEYMNNLNKKTISDSKVEEDKLKTNIIITDRDKEILKFIETYGAISIKQCNKLFIKSETNCKKRLKQLEEAGKLKSYTIGGTRQKGYYTNKPKTLHDIYVIDIYIKLVELGATILNFKQTPYLKINSKTIVPDGYISYKLNGKKKNLYIEIDYTHFTGQDKINLYEKLEGDFDLLIVKEGELRVKSETININRVGFGLENSEKFF